MFGFHPTFATSRIVLVTTFVAAALAAKGCIAPVQVTSLDGDSTEPAKRQTSKLTPATIASDNIVDPAKEREAAPPEPVSRPIVEQPVVAIPLPLTQNSQMEHRAEPRFASPQAPPAPSREYIAALPETLRLPSDVVQATGLPLASGPEVTRLPAADESLPVPPLANPYLAPSVEPFTPPWMLPQGQPPLSAQVVTAPPPPALPMSPPAEFLPAAPLPVQPVYVPNVPAPPPNAETIQPGGQLSLVQRIKPIQQISLNIAAPAIYDDTGAAMQLPQNHATEILPQLAEQRPFTRNDLMDYGLEWVPPPVGMEFCYQPLYFEEVNLERYGRSWGILQPAVSAFHFYRTIPRLPYHIFAQPARRCTYHAHWTLPGYRISCREPREWHPSVLGATAEFAAVYGMILLIP